MSESVELESVGPPDINKDIAEAKKLFGRCNRFMVREHLQRFEELHSQQQLLE